MSESINKILFWENFLESSENTKNKIRLNDVNYWQLCRTCLIETTTDDIDLECGCLMDEQEGRFLNLQEVLTNLAKSEVPGQDEVLPLKICNECLEKIKIIFYFTKQIKNAEKVLRKLADKLKINTIKDFTTTITPTNNELNIEGNSEFIKEEITDDDIVNNFSNTRNNQYNCKIKNEIIDSGELLRNSKELAEDEFGENNRIFCKQEQELIINDNGLNQEFYSVTEILPDAGEQHIEQNNAFYQLQENSKKSAKVKRNSKNSSADNAKKIYDNKCAICGKIFDSRPDFVKHAKEVHPNAKAFKCVDCSKLLLNLLSIHRHNREAHGMQKWHPCEYCPKTFKRKQHYLSHLAVHSVNRPHPCNLCDNTFNSNRVLRDHKLTHASERPYTCLLCPKTFKYRSNLRKHKFEHENQTILKY